MTFGIINEYVFGLSSALRIEELSLGSPECLLTVCVLEEPKVRGKGALHAAAKPEVRGRQPS